MTCQIACARLSVEIITAQMSAAGTLMVGRPTRSERWPDVKQIGVRIACATQPIVPSIIQLRSQPHSQQRHGGLQHHQPAFHAPWNNERVDPSLDHTSVYQKTPRAYNVRKAALTERSGIAETRKG